MGCGTSKDPDDTHAKGGRRTTICSGRGGNPASPTSRDSQQQVRTFKSVATRSVGIEGFELQRGRGVPVDIPVHSLRGGGSNVSQNDSDPLGRSPALPPATVEEEDGGSSPDDVQCGPRASCGSELDGSDAALVHDIDALMFAPPASSGYSSSSGAHPGAPASTGGGGGSIHPRASLGALTFESGSSNTLAPSVTDTSVSVGMARTNDVSSGGGSFPTSEPFSKQQVVVVPPSAMTGA